MATTRSSSTPPASAGTGVQAQPVRPQVEIRSSNRRRKTAAAFYEGDRIVVLVPSRLGSPDREETAERLVNRLLKRRTRITSSDAGLEARAATLAHRYLDGVRPDSIRWVSNQRRRWGSCTPATRTIRLSDRLQVVPDWVLDSVIVHELAHLIEASHSARFHSLAGRYPRMTEADAYLDGYSLGMASGSWEPTTQAPDAYDACGLFCDSDQPPGDTGERAS